MHNPSSNSHLKDHLSPERSAAAATSGSGALARSPLSHFSHPKSLPTMYWPVLCQQVKHELHQPTHVFNSAYRNNISHRTLNKSTWTHNNSGVRATARMRLPEEQILQGEVDTTATPTTPGDTKLDAS